MEILARYAEHSDSRGLFVGLMNEGTWEEFNYIETVAGGVRGGHFHRSTVELFFIIEGEIDVEVRRLGETEGMTVTVRTGDLFRVEPLEVHTFRCRTGAKWMNFLSRRHDSATPDIHVETE